VPSDILAQLKGQRGLVFIPRPGDGEIRHDRAESVLRHMLIEEDEIVEGWSWTYPGFVER
jgi:hypothetical protein